MEIIGHKTWASSGSREGLSYVINYQLMFLLNKELKNKEQRTKLRPDNGSSGISIPAHFYFTLFMHSTDLCGNLSYNLQSTVFCFHIFYDSKVITHM